MPLLHRIDAGDRALIQIVDGAVAEAARKSGPWLICRLGCTQCCIGPFPISQLDALRLQRGLEELEAHDPERALRVRDRARQSVARIARDFPGDPVTGRLAEGTAAEERFADFADDEPCPALDPETGGCDLYSARPITCRTFGPPMRCGDEAVAVCELCFEGASEAEIAACEVEVDSDELESLLLDEIGQTSGAIGRTIVAFPLAMASVSAGQSPSPR
jgi:Fe-S-cluster containining protein